MKVSVPLQDEKLISTSGLFDQAFYEEQVGKRLGPRLAAVRHYCTTGIRKGFDPHPLFSTKFYLGKNFDIRSSNLNPLAHYIRHGDAEGRDPHPLFDVEYFLDQLEEAEELSGTSVEHYLSQDTSVSQLDPNPLFSNDGYLLEYPDVQASRENPLVHYIKHGVSEFRRAIPENIVNRILDAGEYQLLLSRSTSRKHQNQPTHILCSHDASRTGAPLIILNIAKTLYETHRIRLRILLLEGGELESEFAKYGDVVVLERLAEFAPFRASTIRMALVELLRGERGVGIVNSAESRVVGELFSYLEIPFVSLVHEFAQAYPKNDMEGIFFFSEEVVLPSDIVKESYAELLGRELPKASVLQQGLFPDRESSLLELEGVSIDFLRQQLAHRHGISSTSKLVVGMGYVDNRKGCDLFCLTAQLIKEKNRDVDVEFVWVGKRRSRSSNADFGFWLESDVAQSRISSYVKFIGEVEDPSALLTAADVFFLSSRLDPFPCVVLEAMSAGTPFVCFENTTGSAELASAGAGTAVPAFNLYKAATAIEAYLGDEELAATTGAAGTTLIAENYNYFTYVEKILDKTIALRTPADGHPADLEERTASKRKMIVLAANWSLSGVNSAAEIMAKSMIARGWNVEICFSISKHEVLAQSQLADDSYLPDIPITYLVDNESSLRERWRKLIEHIESQTPVVVLSTFDAVANSIFPALGNGVGVVLWNQSDSPEYYEQTHRLGLYANLIVNVSEEISQQVSALNSRYTDRSITIPNPGLWKSELEYREASRNSSCIKLIYAGRFVEEQKRILEFIPLAKAFQAAGIEYELTLVGADDTDPDSNAKLRKGLEEEVKAGAVKIIPRVSRKELLQLFDENHFFVLLSDYEGMPLALLEAMGRGCIPASISIESGVSSVLSHMENGLVFEDRNYDEWASLIAEVFGSNDYTSLSRCAVDTITNSYTTEAVAEKFGEAVEKVYEEITAGTYHRPKALVWNAKFGDVLPPQGLTLTI